MEEKKLVIIGTAHVSPKSIEEVERLIEEEKPDAVAVELCPRRYNALVHGVRDEVPVTEIIKKGNVFLIIFQLMLSYFISVGRNKDGAGAYAIHFTPTE